MDGTAPTSDDETPGDKLERGYVVWVVGNTRRLTGRSGFAHDNPSRQNPRVRRDIRWPVLGMSRLAGEDAESEKPTTGFPRVESPCRRRGLNTVTTNHDRVPVAYCGVGREIGRRELVAPFRIAGFRRTYDCLANSAVENDCPWAV